MADFIEVEMGGTIYEFPADMPEKEMMSILDNEWAKQSEGSEEMEQPGWEVEPYVDMLAMFEGTEAHKSLEGGKDTLAFGVKFPPPGVDTNQDPRQVAAQTAQWHHTQAKQKLGALGVDMGTLPTAVQTMMTDLHYNTGTLFRDTPRRLAEGDMEGAIKNTLNIIGATQKGKKVTFGGLAFRRARVANAAFEELGLPTIKQVEIKKLNPARSGGARTEYRYVAEDGSVIHSVRTARALSSTQLDADGTRVEIL